MKPSLQFRLSQHLALTPQLQQSIRLLQLSTLELHQEIEQMLEQNPFLEPEDDFSPIETAASLEFERQRNEHNSSEDAGAERESSPTEADTSGIDTAEMGTTERDDWENGTERDDFDGMARFDIRAPRALARFIAEKGSICLDGTSLTVNAVEAEVFSVLLIPHTLAVTTWGGRRAGDRLNIEVDLMARYAARLAEAPR